MATVFLTLYIIGVVAIVGVSVYHVVDYLKRSGVPKYYTQEYKDEKQKT